MKFTERCPETVYTVLTFCMLATCHGRPLLITLKYKGKGKAIPLQAWTGPEGSRRLRLPDFNTIGT